MPSEDPAKKRARFADDEGKEMEEVFGERCSTLDPSAGKRKDCTNVPLHSCGWEGRARLIWKSSFAVHCLISYLR